jgi:hypothetical protein
MRVTTKIVIDMRSGAVLEHEFFEYDGPVALCKGDQTVKSAENSQFQFSQTLQAAFAKQFGVQSATLQFLTNKLTDAVNNPQGLSPEALAATRTNASQRTATDYAHAQQAINGQIAARGGSTLPSGVDAQIRGSLAQGAANEESESQNQITLANENDQLGQEITRRVLQSRAPRATASMNSHASLEPRAK